MKTLVTLITIFILLSLNGLGQNLNSGLIGCWEFNEASGTVANASNKPTVNGTIDGATVNQTGKVGKAYDFDGADDLVSIPITDHYTTFSFSAWVYINTVGESAGRVMDKYAGVSPLETHINVGADVVGGAGYYRFYYSRFRSTTVGEWGTRPGARKLATNTWAHIVVTYDASSTSNDPIFYVNGDTVHTLETSTPSGTLNENTSPYYIGNRSGKDRSFDGIIDQPCIWNRILTPAEVTQLYNAGVGYQFAGKNAFMTNF